ncbi:MAG: hypothetical protein ABFS32_22540 [Bacteroidota bacterium]
MKRNLTMKAIIIAFSMIVVPVAMKAQGSMRPVLDSTVTCSYYKGTYEFSENAAKAKQVLEVFYIVEEMPKPNTRKRDIEDTLNAAILMNKKEKTYQGAIELQCVVNCKGKAGDFQIIDCPTEILNIGYQVLDTLRDIDYEWQPGRQGDSEVDVLIKIKVSVSEGMFSVVAPVVFTKADRNTCHALCRNSESRWTYPKITSDIL